VPERGLRVSLFGSAIGAAYLSTQSDAEVRRLSDRARISVAEHEALNRRLAGVRVDGFAEGPSAGGGIWSIAAPLPAGSFNVPLVLGLAGPATRVQSNLRALSAALRTGILRISRK